LKSPALPAGARARPRAVRRLKAPVVRGCPRTRRTDSIGWRPTKRTLGEGDKNKSRIANIAGVVDAFLDGLLSKSHYKG